MHNITLISTIHGANGQCNSNELYRIIQRIKPQVIFEEKPPSFFAAYYEEYTRNSLESDAILDYLEDHEVVQVLVDYHDVPDSFWPIHKKMFESVEVSSYDYRRLHDEHQFHAAREGFRFLNSNRSIELYAGMKDAMANSLRQLGNEALTETYNLWIDLNDERENHMLKNIYDYCINTQFETGVFYIGVSHRAAIIKKIQELAKTEAVKVSWNYEDYDGIL